MTQITYVEHNGTEHTQDVPNGDSVMEGAVSNDVPGIDADCGGACACATCHIKLDQEWFDKLGEREATEESMLALAVDVQPTSRLACQITVVEELEGLRVYMPESQF